MNKKYHNNLLWFLLFGSTEHNLFISSTYFPPCMLSLAFCRPEWLHPPTKATQLYDTSGRRGSFCGKLLTTLTVGAVIISAIYSVSVESGE